jgi:hypothetical protein
VSAHDYASPSWEADEAEEEGAPTSLQGLADILQTGDIVYFGAGTYTEAVVIDSVTDVAFVADTAGTYTGYPGEVILDQGGGLTISNSSGVRISGFVFQGPAAEMILWSNSTGGRIESCQFTTGTVGIKAICSGLAVNNCQLLNLTSFAVHCADSDVQITNCQATADDGVYVSGTSNVTIDGLRFDGSAASGTHWAIYRTGGDLTVSNSIFHGYQNGIYLEDSQAAYQVTVRNATFADLRHYGVYVASGSARVVNSILSGSSAAYALVDGGGQLTHAYNLIHGFSYPYYGTTAAATEVLKDPRFVDAANGDFHLGPGSPAINAGLDLTCTVTADIEGNARPTHRVYEIGAYEYARVDGSVRVLSWRELE